MNARGGLFFLQIWLQASQNIFLKVWERLHLNSSDRCYWQCLTLSSESCTTYLQTSIEPSTYPHCSNPSLFWHWLVITLGDSRWLVYISQDPTVNHTSRPALSLRRCQTKLRVQASSKVSATVCMLLNSDDTRQITMIWVDEDVWLL